ncbi:MAG: hypothetical protein IJ303_00765, partial [Clostridia bacterium]|nr:hypothetical protein [Clostridia bacterium]
MKEKEYLKSADTPLLQSEIGQRILPDFPGRKSKKISLYLLLTLSAAIIMLGFIFADTGVRIFSNKIENWPSALLSGYCKENTGKYDVKLSE